MALKRPPRITTETREQLRAAVVAAVSVGAADQVIDRLWSILEGDMQDRISQLIDQAKGVDKKAYPGVARAVADLAGKEVAATSTKQLKEGPWHGH